MKVETIVLNKERNVTLTAFIQETGGKEFPRVKRRPSVLVLPGGGYDMCSATESEPVALGYAKAGFQAFVLRYSVKEHKAWPNPLNDYEQAMELIKKNSEKWNLYKDKIAVVGFSAGGHLAGCAATIAKNRPDAAILVYAVLSNKGLHNLVAAEDAPVNKVDGKTPPCFFVQARDDMLVSPKHSLDFQQALLEKGITFESHIYAYGGHGFASAERSLLITRCCNRLVKWIDDSIEWLKDIFGDFGNGELGKPRIGKHITDDAEPYFSVDCTAIHLLKYEKLLGEEFAKPLQLIFTVLPEGVPKEAIFALGAIVRLREVLLAKGFSEAEIEAIDEKMRKIPNAAAAKQEK